MHHAGLTHTGRCIYAIRILPTEFDCLQTVAVYSVLCSDFCYSGMPDG